MKKPVRLIGLVIALIATLLLSGCGGPAKTYENAQKALVNGEYEKAAELFESISTYEDSSKLAMYSKALAYGEKKNYDKAIDTLEFLGDYKDSAQLIEYYGICKLANSTKIVDILSAADQFDAISAYRDSAQRAEECRQSVYDTALAFYNARKYDDAILVFSQIDNYKDSGEQIAKCQEAKNADAYAFAEQLFAEGNYQSAISAFLALGDYRDSAERAAEVGETEKSNAYSLAEEAFQNGEYQSSIQQFEALGSYRDSKQRIKEVQEAWNASKYELAESLRAEGKYDEAITGFEQLGAYKDAKEQVTNSKYLKATTLFDNEQYTEALIAFYELNEYKDSSTYIDTLWEKTKLCEGDVILFGKSLKLVDSLYYEFDINGKAEWIILDFDKDKGLALLISKNSIGTFEMLNVFDAKKLAEVTWENSELRRILNVKGQLQKESYYSMAFDDNEKGFLREMESSYYSRIVTRDSLSEANAKLYENSKKEVAGEFNWQAAVRNTLTEDDVERAHEVTSKDFVRILSESDLQTYPMVLEKLNPPSRDYIILGDCLTFSGGFFDDHLFSNVDSDGTIVLRDSDSYSDVYPIICIDIANFLTW